MSKLDLSELSKAAVDVANKEWLPICKEIERAVIGNPGGAVIGAMMWYLGNAICQLATDQDANHDPLVRHLKTHIVLLAQGRAAQIVRESN